MIRFIIVCTVMLTALSSQAQRWESAMFFGGTDGEFTTGIAIIPGGKIAMAGKFGDSIVMKNGTYYGQLPYPANDNYFVTLLDSNGNELWMKTFSKNITNSIGVIGTGYSTMLSDKLGNTYVNVNFTNTSPTSVYFSGGINYNMPGASALLKFDSNGNLLWYKSYSNIIRISIDHTNNVYVNTVLFGNFNTATINDYTLNYTGLIDPVFLLKLDQNGNTLSAKVINNKNVINSVVYDSTGNYYLKGGVNNTSGIIDFIDGTQDITIAQSASYWMKFDATGNLLWAKYSVEVGASQLRLVSVNKEGTLLGNIATLTPSYSFNYEGVSVNPNGKNLLVHVLMDSSGAIKKVAEVEVMRTAFSALGATFNKEGYFYAVGRYAPAAIFGDSTIPDGGNNSTDGYAVKYNSDGEQIWFRAITGLNNQQIRYVVTDNDYVYLAASFDASAAFVNGKYVDAEIGWNYNDIFFSRLRDCNAALTKSGRTLQANSGIGYKWFRDGAVESGISTQNYSPVYNGRYQVEVSFAGGCKCKTASLNFTEAITAIHDQAVMESIQLFPNPAILNVMLQAPVEAGILSVSLLNSQGKIVWSGTMEGSGEIPLKEKAPGLYTVLVVSSRGFWQEKLVVE